MITKTFNKNTILKSAVVFLLFCITAQAWAIKLPQTNPVPGGIAIVPLGISSSSAPIVKYEERRVMVSPKPGDKWVAIVGIPLSAKKGTHELTVETNPKQHRVTFKVRNKKYKTQHITLKNKRKVNPNKKDLERIVKEKKLIVASLATWRDTPDVNTEFVPPVKGRLSSPFGLRRFFNKQPRKPHSGIDIAAPEGTPIVSPASGIVVNTGDYFFNGNSIFIDHGQGLVTMYCHMSKINVKPGQQVAQGEQIGAIGKTGRATGPHLHWGITLNKTSVDPGLFFEDLKTLSKKK